MPINRLYLDSNILIGQGWPMISAELRNCLTVAASVNVNAFFPALVEMEVEAKWLRDFEENKRHALSRLDSLARHTPLFTKPRLQFPTVDEARAEYRQRANDAKADLKVSSSPITSRSSAELLEKAAYHLHPFPDSDSSFRDAVIVLSIADHLDAVEQPMEVIFLTGDEFFKKFNNYKTPKGSVIRVHKDLASAQSVLVPMLTRIVVVEWMAKADQARNVAEGDIPALEQFLRGNLDVPIGVGWIFGPRVLEVRNISVEEVIGVTVPLPSEHPNNAEVPVSISARAKIEKLVEVSQAQFRPSSLRAGQALEEVPKYEPPTKKDLTTSHNVTVQAVGHVVNGQYQSFQYQSAALDATQP